MLRNNTNAGVVALPARTVTTISKDTLFEGNLNTTEAVRVIGTLKGNITSTALVTIEADGKVIGDIVAENLNVLGYAEGSMKVNDKTTVTAVATVKGELTTSVISIEEGAFFGCNCIMAQKVSASAVDSEAPSFLKDVMQKADVSMI